MTQMFEATWYQGKIIPQKTMNVKENAHLIIIVLDDYNTEVNPEFNWQHLRGKYKGKLSTTDQYICNKKIEKELEL